MGLLIDCKVAERAWNLLTTKGVYGMGVGRDVDMGSFA